MAGLERGQTCEQQPRRGGTGAGGDDSPGSILSVCLLIVHSPPFFSLWQKIWLWGQLINT